MEDRLESGVSPLVGTILVLGISVAGTAVALLLGAPALQRLQEQAALDTMLAQFGTVDEATDAMSIVGDGRTLSLSMPSGSIRVEPGTQWMVTLGQDPGRTDCDFRVLAWADGDDEVHVTSADCRTLIPEELFDATCTIPLLGVELALGNEACFYAYRVEGATEIPLVAWARSATRFELNESVDATADYVFRLTNRAGVTYAESWLLHSDRLRWTGGLVGVDYDVGTLVAHGRAGDRAVTTPRLDEGTDPLGPTLLVLPALRVEQGSELSGSGTRSIGLSLEASHVRQATRDANGALPSFRVRFDLAGDNARALCQSIQGRNDGVAPEWTPDGPGGTCGASGDEATSPAVVDDTHSLLYDPPDGSGTDRPTFSLTQMVFRVTLKP